MTRLADVCASASIDEHPLNRFGDVYATHGLGDGRAEQRTRLDSKVGGIAVGRKADFDVLAKNLVDLRPSRTWKIEIWGTVFEGRVCEAP